MIKQRSNPAFAFITVSCGPAEGCHFAGNEASRTEEVTSGIASPRFPGTVYTVLAIVALLELVIRTMVIL